MATSSSSVTRLYNDGSGNNYVDQYRQYRSSVAGGGHTARVYDINELTDQFGFWYKRPSRIRQGILSAMPGVISALPQRMRYSSAGHELYRSKATESNPLSDQLNLVPTFGWPPPTYYWHRNGLAYPVFLLDVSPQWWGRSQQLPSEGHRI